MARTTYHRIQDHMMRVTVAISVRAVAWTIAISLVALSFAVIYYWAPGSKKRCWHWLTPGGTIGIAGWVLASLGLRAYLHFFDSYTITYGSLGAVITLLTWFYITGLMILLGAELNSQIEAAAAEIKLGRSEDGVGVSDK
jgi:membrane protein